VIHLERMLKEFYALMGWQEDGSIGPAKLEELGLAGLVPGPELLDPKTN